MPHIKENRICAHRTLTHRNIEDWRQESPAPNRGRWAIHCIDHDQRKFVRTYHDAKDLAPKPSTCDLCEAFDLRCVYCPSDRDKWTFDATTGFVPSTGHIMGNAVCSHHKYGALPEGTDYLEVMNVVLAKPLVEIFVGQAFIGSRVCTVEYQTGDGRFWLRLETPFLFMTTVSAAEYHQAIGFALKVAQSLNGFLDQPSGDPSFVPTTYESWEARASRLGHG